MIGFEILKLNIIQGLDPIIFHISYSRNTGNGLLSFFLNPQLPRRRPVGRLASSAILWS